MGYDKNKYKKFITQKVLLENEIFNEYEIAFKNSSEYKSIIKKKNLSEKEKEEQISNKMIEFIKGIEIDKFSIFQLVNYQNTLIIKAPNDNEEQKKFLGYDWSNAKGNEGIKYITDVAASGDDDETIENIKKISSIKTTLYDPAVLDNPEKLNFIIREAFDGKLKQFNENLKPYANLVNLRDCIDFRRASFDKAINLSAKSKVEITSKYPMVKLGTLLNTIETGSRPNGGVGNLNEGALSLGGEHIHNTNGIINLVNPKFVSIEYYENNQKGRLKQNDILLCKDGALTGKIALLRDELNNRRAMVNEHIFILRAADIITQKYIFYFLYSPLGQQILKQNITGAAQGGLNSTNLKNIRIPFSNNKENKKVFQKIVAECEKVDKEFKTIRMEIGELKAKMSEIFTKFGISFNSNGGGYELISNFCNILIGGTPKRDNSAYYGGENLWLSISEMNSNVITDTKEKITNLGVKNSNVKLIPEGTTLVSFKLSIGKTAIAGTDLYTNEAIAAFVVKKEFKDKILDKFIFCLFDTKFIKLQKNGLNAFGQSLNLKDLNLIKIPLLPLSIQKQIVTDFEVLESEISQREQKLANLQGKYNEILNRHL